MMTEESPMPDIERLIDKKASLTEYLPLPTRETLPQELVDIAEKIRELTGTWNPVELYTPNNAHSEKDRFLEEFIAGRVYNPQFTYSNAENFTVGSSREQLVELYKRVVQYKPADRVGRLSRVALRYKIQDDLATLDLAQGLQEKDEKKISRALASKYPGTDQQLLQVARDIYQTRFTGSHKIPTTPGVITEEEKKILEAREFTPEETAAALSWALDQYGLLRIPPGQTGFAVKISSDVTDVDVRDKSKDGLTVFVPIRRDRPLDGVKFLKLIAHEIEGHARQSANGERLFLIGGGKLKIDDETSYEGLAKRSDDLISRKLFGTAEGIPIPYYAFAVRAAEEGHSFSEIFQTQLELRLREELKILLFQTLPPTSAVDQKILAKIHE